MRQWCGGSTAERELAGFDDRTRDLRPIAPAEYEARRRRLQSAMAAADCDAVYLDAGSSLTYFTGVVWHGSERLTGALIFQGGEPTFLVPFFEAPAFAERVAPGADMALWHEHDSPERLLASRLGGGRMRLAIDPTTPFGRAERLRSALVEGSEIRSAEALITACRSRKSQAEIALMQRAFDITLSVQAAAARILRPGITTAEVVRFIDTAHRASGAPGGSLFSIVLFGADTSFPHGVASPKALEVGDTVLVDTGCVLHGYCSDLTRSYVFGTPSGSQRRVWDDERAAQEAAFAAAQPGQACEAVDAAVRTCLTARGYGPDYALPGLPHRTGHGLGLDIHEAPFFVRGDTTPLAEGMCISIEPMLCLPGEFGIRLEDHIHMSEAGPVWFTQPATSIDLPFAG